MNPSFIKKNRLDNISLHFYYCRWHRHFSYIQKRVLDVFFLILECFLFFLFKGQPSTYSLFKLPSTVGFSIRKIVSFIQFGSNAQHQVSIFSFDSHIFLIFLSRTNKKLQQTLGIRLCKCAFCGLTLCVLTTFQIFVLQIVLFVWAKNENNNIANIFFPFVALDTYCIACHLVRPLMHTRNFPAATKRCLLQCIGLFNVLCHAVCLCSINANRKSKLHEIHVNKGTAKANAQNVHVHWDHDNDDKFHLNCVRNSSFFPFQRFFHCDTAMLEHSKYLSQLLGSQSNSQKMCCQAFRTLRFSCCFFFSLRFSV